VPWTSDWTGLCCAQAQFALRRFYLRRGPLVAFQAHSDKEFAMLPSATLPMTRRCFFVSASAAALLAAAQAAAQTKQTLHISRDSADGPDMPSAALLNSGEAPAYLLVFHTGQHVMKGLLAFAKKN